MTRQHSKGDAVTRTSDPQGALTVSRFPCMPSKGVLRAQLHTVVYVSQEQNLPRDPCTGDSGATSWKGSQMCSSHPHVLLIVGALTTEVGTTQLSGNTPNGRGACFEAVSFKNLCLLVPAALPKFPLKGSGEEVAW